MDNISTKEKFFAETLGLIYKIRNITLHGSYNPVDIYFQNAVKGAYQVFGIILNRVFEKQEKLFFCIDMSRNVNAQGLLVNPTRMTLLTGSHVALQADTSYGSLRRRKRRKSTLISTAIQQGHYFEITENIPFSNPSASSSFCLGRNSDGQIDWKSKSGKILSDILKK